MKKLIIVMAAIAMACASQAATVKWSTGTVKLPDGTTNMSASNSTLYFWASSVSDPWGTKASATGEGDAAVYTVAASEGTQTYRSGAATITGSSSTYSVGDTALATVIITRDANSDGKIGVGDYYMIGTGSYSVESDANKTVNLDMGSWVQIASQGGGGSGGSEDVPEPTSGLLLALGGAMLALRRRRA